MMVAMVALAQLFAVHRNAVEKHPAGGLPDAGGSRPSAAAQVSDFPQPLLPSSAST